MYLSSPTSLNPCPLTPSPLQNKKTHTSLRKLVPAHCEFESLISFPFHSISGCCCITSGSCRTCQSFIILNTLNKQTNKQSLCLHHSGNPRSRLCFLKLATIAKARGSVRGGRARGSKASASRSSRKAAASAKRAARKLKRQERGWRPKRALGPYMFFCKDQHANVTADNPNIPFTEVGRILGAQWQQMTEKDKKPYIKKSEADKKRYLKDLKRCKNK